MEANELRIGNLVKHVDDPFIWIINRINVSYINIGKYIEMYEISGYNDVDKYRQYFQDELIKFEPIPLTEEWLLKFGFEDNKLSHQPNVFVYHNGGVYVHGMSGAIHPIEIKYVHQLQNLYFALTGEELNNKQREESK